MVFLHRCVVLRGVVVLCRLVVLSVLRCRVWALSRRSVVAPRAVSSAFAYAKAGNCVRSGGGVTAIRKINIDHSAATVAL